MNKITLESALALAKDVLLRCHVDVRSVVTLTDTFLYADKRGITTHGISRLPLYVEKIHSGHLNPLDQVEVISDSMGVAVMDAKNTFGQIAASHAVDTVLNKAKHVGIAAVGVRNSNNFGCAGYFGELIAKKGYIGFVFANAAPAIAPTGGTIPLLGTNPICFSFPGNDQYAPIVLDMATTVAARGKIRKAAKEGTKIPDNWATDSSGVPTTDPNEALKGLLLPIGGYKGYGLSLFVDIFAGLLTGSAFAGQVNPLGSLDNDSGNGHLFIALNPAFFLTEEDMNARISCLYRSVKKCGEPDKVFLPGEQGLQRYSEKKDYILLSDAQCDSIQKSAAEVGSDKKLKSYFS